MGMMDISGKFAGAISALVVLLFLFMLIPYLLSTFQGFRGYATGYCDITQAPDNAFTIVPVGMDLKLAAEGVTNSGDCSTTTSGLSVTGTVPGYTTTSWQFDYTPTFMSQSVFGGLARILIDLMPLLVILQWVLPIVLASWGARKAFGKFKPGG